MQENEFYIPANYLDSGYALNGRFAKRNAVEAVILAVAGFLVVQTIGIPFSIDNISIYIFVCCPLALIGASGIQGDPLSEYILNAFKWAKNRSPYFFNSHISAYRIAPAQLILDQPNLRDVLNDKFDSFRKSMAAQQVEYEEGINFVFASDPELEALREAEDRLIQEEEERSAEAVKSSYNDVQPLTDTESFLDVDAIANNIILTDYEGGS